MRVVLMLCVIMSLTACSMNKEQLGLSKKSPDETVVESRGPLSLPPEFEVRPNTFGK
ncbi:MAG: DUF3035 domain-containing protein [Alphaproteobacteria bacterium]|nr:DUF3035 domain-containing protein [Alphaproteobacteria bacterium]